MVGENGSVEVRLSVISGEPLATFHVEPGCIASEVKNMVEEELGYPPKSQQLLVQSGDTVEDDASLNTFPKPLSLTLVLLPFEKARALFSAANNGHEAAVRRLLSHTALDQQECLQMLVHEEGDWTALHAAACRGHSSVCVALLEAARGTEELVNILAATDGQGYIALHWAAGGDSGDDAADAMTCRALLAAAPNEEVLHAMLLAQDDVGETALQTAAGVGKEASCCALLEAAPNEEVLHAMLMETGGYVGQTALHKATQRGHEMVCRVLLGAATAEIRCEVLAVPDGFRRTAAQVADIAVRHMFESA